MNLVLLQYTVHRGWVLTYNGNYIRSWSDDDPLLPFTNENSLHMALRWLERNPEGWSGDVQVQIVGTLSSVVGRE